MALAMALEYREQGERIAELRDQAHLSQEAVARQVGVSHSAYQKWEAGGGIRGENLRNLAKVLGVAVEQITGQVEPVNPFSIARHLDENVELFRQYSYEMQNALERVEAKVDLLASALLDGGAIAPDEWAQAQAAAERLAEEPAADAPPAPRKASGGRR